MKKLLKQIKPIRRLYDGFIASTYFNHKYIKIIKWMLMSNEDTNYTYDLTQKNLDELIKTIEIVFPEYPHKQISKLINEIIEDDKLKEQLQARISTSSFRAFADKKIKFSRRLGWYVVVKILKPKIIIETGVDKGMGAMLLCRALEINQKEGFNGKYYGTDINPIAGYLFDEPLTKHRTIVYGDSIDSLKKLNESIDLFINDSDHSASYEYQEYHTIKDKLSPRAIILGDNSHCTNKLLQFSFENNRNFLFFKEEPKNYWYPGAGIGISYPKTL